MNTDDSLQSVVLSQWLRQKWSMDAMLSRQATGPMASDVDGVVHQALLAILGALHPYGHTTMQARREFHLLLDG